MSSRTSRVPADLSAIRPWLYHIITEYERLVNGRTAQCDLAEWGRLSAAALAEFRRASELRLLIIDALKLNVGHAEVQPTPRQSQQVLADAKALATRLGLLALTLEGCPDRDVTPSVKAIFWLGSNVYQITGGEERTVQPAEHDVLQAFIKQNCMDFKTLKRMTGLEKPDRTLAQLVKNYEGEFAPAIRMPGEGRKGAGGYYVRIQKDVKYKTDDAK